MLSNRLTKTPLKAAQAEIKRKENKQWENMEHTEALIPPEQSIRKIIR